jgi:hypothetical protein
MELLTGPSLIIYLYVRITSSYFIITLLHLVAGAAFEYLRVMAA